MKEPIISVSGLRGIVGQSLTPDVVMRYIAAYAASLPAGAIVVSRDGRPSGRMISEIVRGTLAAAGRTVIDADIAATPTVGVLVRARGAVGGIQISASHNPSPYNGMKLFDAGGRVLTAVAGQRVMSEYRAGVAPWVDHQGIGSTQRCDDPHQEHLDLVLATIDVERIRRRKFKVILDANAGAGSLLGRRLLDALACQTTIVGGEPDGNFTHPPEPTAANLAGVCQEVLDKQADVCFCQDPDADRLAVIDEAGRYIGEECTLALCLDHVLRRRNGAVVTNCATSRMCEDLAKKHAAPFFRSAVGEANVVDMMIAQDAVFGGEGNGGPIDPQVVYVRDSFVGMAFVLNSMAEQERTASQLADELPQWSIHKTTVSLQREKVADALDTLQNHFCDAQPDRTDGLRLDWPDRWLLVRASNTEPIVRLIAEARSRDQAVDLCESTATVLKSVQSA